MNPKIIDLGMPHKKRIPRKPVQMDLSGEEGKRLVLETAKYIIKKHEKVIKALADR